MRQTLRKYEILRSDKDIKTLFLKGKKFTYHALSIFVYYKNINEDRSVKVFFHVKKRDLKKSTDRNRIKRLMREVYRKNKNQIYELLPSGELWMGIHYKSNNTITYTEMEKNILALLQIIKTGLK